MIGSEGLYEQEWDDKFSKKGLNFSGKGSFKISEFELQLMDFENKKKNRSKNFEKYHNSRESIEKNIGKHNLIRGQRNS